MSESGAEAATVVVRGEATVEADPEIVLFAVSVRARAKDRREALANLAQRNEEFTAAVRSFGEAVERIETGEVTVFPELRRGRGRDERVRWYRGVLRSRLTIGDLAVVGELVSKLSEVELCVIEGPWWRLRPGSPVYREARVQAARAAVTRAGEYAEAVGGRLLSLLELADTGTAAPQRLSSFQVARGASSQEPGPDETPAVIELEPETQIIQAAVEARFTMSQPATLG